MGFIYKIWNEVNDNLYIGQTSTSISERWSNHKQKIKEKNNNLYLSMRKYGIDKFHIEELEEVPNEQLDEREKYWIAFYNTYYNGYNSTLGGEGAVKSNISIE